MPSHPQLAANLTDIQERIARACERCGRSPTEVTLVAVTKYADMQWVRGLYEHGLRDFGESRPQQLVQRAVELPSDVRWHLIGHLQRNKAASVLPYVQWIHSVDSLRLCRQLEKDATQQDRQVAILLEVNVSGEASKDGFTPDELKQAWSEITACPHLEPCGLMTMAPLADDPETARPCFRALRELKDELSSRSAGPPLTLLSMGMSGDFEIAIEEGATHIRIGSSLFEGLPQSAE